MYQLDRGLTAASTVGISAAAIGAVGTTKSAGYTPSFYDFVPIWVWAGLVLALVGGLGLLVRGTFAQRRPLFARGALIIGATYGVLYFLPQATGFKFWSFSRADALMHFSYAEYIMSTGASPASNMYPGTHFIVAQTALITGLPVEALQPIVMYLVTGVFVAGCAVFGRALGGKPAGQCVFIAAVPLVLGKYMQHLMPWFIAFALLPITLFVAESLRKGQLAGSNTVSATLCAAVLLFGIVFIHPMSAALAGVVLGCGLIAVTAYNWRTVEIERQYRVTWGLLIAIPLVAWYFAMPTFSRLARQTALSLVAASPGAAARAGEAGASGYTTWQIIRRYAIGEFGTLILYLAAGGVIALWFGYTLFHGRDIKSGEVVACAIYVTGGTIGVIFVMFRAIITEFYRMNQLTLFGAILLIGLGMAVLHTHNDNLRSGVLLNSVATSALVLVVITAGSLAVFNVYDERRHATQAEFEGVNHHMTYANYDLNTRSLRVSAIASEYTIGTQRASNIPWTERPFHQLRPNSGLPDDLGYTTNKSVSSLFDGRGYIVISERNQDWVAVEPPNRHQYVKYISDEEMSRLRSDNRARQVYDNGGSWIWWVR
ncbi:DUF6541 family protein [Haloarcula sp. CBA1115]|uniref:DUF6541 family protein n=1 Tax=unclassified Haloarcula TaxID=2624677 RepID=UPI000A5806CD